MPPAQLMRTLLPPRRPVAVAAVSFFVMASIALPRNARAAASAGFAPRSRKSVGNSAGWAGRSRPLASSSAVATAATATAQDRPPPSPPPHRDGTVRVARRLDPRPPPPPAASWFGGGGSRKKKKKKKRRAGSGSASARVGQDVRLQPPRAECKTVNLEVSYRIYRPECLRGADASSEGKAPLLVLHGGPSLPSEYLYPLASHIPDGRAVIFYDQIGCGRSSIPPEFDVYGIPQSVDDLQILIQHLGLDRFHLLGHSYGGALAYEYVKRVVERGEDEGTDVIRNDREIGGGQGVKGQAGGGRRGLRRPLSLILSNAPTSMRLSDMERSRLLEIVRRDMRSDPLKLEFARRTSHDVFFRRNQCRTAGGVPPELASAFRHAGGVWAGTDVVMDYAAAPPSPGVVAAGGRAFPPVFVLRGEHDFVTEQCTRGWGDIFGSDNVLERVMEGCSHYCHFEAPEAYGVLVDSYCSEHENRK